MCSDSTVLNFEGTKGDTILLSIDEDYLPVTIVSAASCDTSYQITFTHRKYINLVHDSCPQLELLVLDSEGRPLDSYLHHRDSLNPNKRSNYLHTSDSSLLEIGSSTRLGSFKLFPNPAVRSKQLHLQLVNSSHEPVTIQVFDGKGGLLKSVTLDKPQAILNWSFLPNFMGFCTVAIRQDGEVVFRKVIVNQQF